MTIEEAADNWDLPLVAIHEAINYCEANQEFLKQEAEEERRRLEAKGVRLEKNSSWMKIPRTYFTQSQKFCPHGAIA